MRIVKRLPQQQANLISLITVAMRNGGLMDADETLPILYATAQTRQFDRHELERMTQIVQRDVQLDWYTTRQAAAWLGLSIVGVANAVKAGRLKAYKPGHDLLITHAELVRFNEQERRYRVGESLPASYL